jgi:uncharacterized repeat protein (TIGR01451 family)
VAAISPRFNFLSNDYPTLQVLDAASGQYASQTTTTTGSRVKMLVWVHNGVPGTTALDTRARVQLPSTESLSHVATGTVWASNADAASNSVTVNANAASVLRYVPGSATLYKNNSGTLVETAWPNGVSGDDVVAPQGVSLGSVDGCWQYAQAVTILVDVESVQPNLAITKQVAPAGSETFSSAITRAPNEQATYALRIENTGTGVATNPVVTDLLEQRTTYVAGSSYLVTTVSGQTVTTPIPDSAITITTTNGRQQLRYSLASIAPGTANAVTIRFSVQLAGTSAFPIGQTTLYNTATVSASSLPTITSNQVTITVVRTPDPVVNFTIDKQVRNDSAGQATWVETVQVTAGSVANPVMGFKIVVANTGNTTATNVLVRDLLPQGLILVSGTVRVTTAQGVTTSLPDSFVGTGSTFATLEPGVAGSKIITFQAQIVRECLGSHTMVNSAEVLYLGQVRDQDTASVVYSCAPGLTISKDARTGSNAFADHAGIVREGQVLTYRVRVTNTGTSVLSNVSVRDVLPQFVTYKENSLASNGVFLSQTQQDAFFGAGLAVGTLQPGEVREYVFQVVVDDCPVLGDTELINTAYTGAQGLTTRSDTARATLRVVVPILR